MVDAELPALVLPGMPALPVAIGEPPDRPAPIELDGNSNAPESPAELLQPVLMALAKLAHAHHVFSHNRITVSVPNARKRV